MNLRYIVLDENLLTRGSDGTYYRLRIGQDDWIDSPRGWGAFCCVGIEDMISETNTITVDLLISGMIWCVSILTEIRFSIMRYPEMGVLGFRKRLMKMAKKAMSFVIGDIFLS